MADLDRGLEHTAVAETRLSYIDGERGELLLAGFPLAELAPNASYEESLHLLYEDRLPTPEELDAFRDDLAAHREIAPETEETLRAAAADGQSAMDALRMGVADASLGRGGDEDPETDALRAVAQVPTVLATYWRYRQGEDRVAPRDDLGHAANYLHMLTGEEPSAEEVRGLETYLNTVIDHGLNASTFTGRVVVSTRSDVISGVTGAVGALKGPLHGGAPGPVLDMLLDAHESGDPERVVKERLESGDRLMGFGHRVYRVRDPRAAVLSDAAERFYADEGDRAFFETARDLEAEGVEALRERKPDARLATNVEFYTAVLLHGIGVPRDLFTGAFAVSRVGGWTAHCLEQLDDNRLIRPRSEYVGATGRTWTPRGDR